MRWTVVLTLFITTNTIADAADDQPFKFTNYAPSTVNFHDIYTNTLALLADEPSTKDDFHITNIPSQFAEFQLPTKTDTSSSTPVQNTNDTSQSDEVITEAITTTTSLTTTRKIVDEVTQDAPPKNVQRGVLDLLLPAYRVKTFKNVFDTFRKVLSYTFR